MIELIGPPARWLHLLSGAVAIGALWWQTRREFTGARLDRLCVYALLIFIVSGSLVLWHQATSATGEANISLTKVTRFAMQTRSGQIWLARLSFAAIIFGYLTATGARRPQIALGMMVLLQGSLALAGHGAAADAWLLALAGHATHVLAARAWLGGLGILAMQFFIVRMSDKSSLAANAMRVFSEFALACMIAIVMSGIVIAALQIRSWPALFGTEYGRRLVIKLALLAGIFAIAGHLRWRVLKTINENLLGIVTRRRIQSWIALEFSFALIVMWIAASLAITAPAQHDQIIWPFAFRIAPQIAWRNPDLQAQFYWGLGLAALAVAWTSWSAQRFGLRIRNAAMGVAVLALGAILALPTLSVPAFPDTYRRSIVPYQTISIANGSRLFAQHCVSCHGADATGNGPMAKSLSKPPADLAAPHAGDHTPGDLYWRLTHGVAQSPMPAFAQLSEEDRWDLVNFVHTLASGYQARVIRERVVTMRPWLGAPDFNYVASDGTSGSLKDFREHTAVLLVLFGNQSNTRLKQLHELHSTLEQHRLQIIAVPLHPTSNTAQIGFPVVTEGSEYIAQSYQLFRRTIENARPGEQGSMPQHMEFLIDRFGYVRGRWLPEDSEPGWRDIRNLIAQIDQLAREPSVRSPPDEHLH